MKDLVGNVATCITVFMFLCPAPTMLKMWKQRSLLDGFNPLPYAFTAVLASQWWYYGAIVNDSHMIVVNAIGALLECAYCVLILRLAQIPSIRRQITACFLFLLGVLSTVQLFERDTGLRFLGTTNVIVNVATFGTPLVTIREVLRTKSCASFPPIILQLAMTLTPLTWTIYATIIDDTFLLIPNALGIALGVFQLSLRCIYPAEPVKYSQLV